MALTKADYEKVLGKSITDVEFKTLTQSRNQDPFASGTTDDPKLINTPFLTSTPWTAPVVEKGVGAIGKNAPKPPSESKGAVAGHSDDPKLIQTPFLTSTPWTPAAPYAPVQTGIGAGVMGSSYSPPPQWTPPAMSAQDKATIDKHQEEMENAPGPPPAPPPALYTPVQPGIGAIVMGKNYAPPPIVLPPQSFGMVNREGDAPPPRVDKAGVWWQPPMVSPTSDETAAKAKKKAAGG